MNRFLLCGVLLSYLSVYAGPTVEKPLQIMSSTTIELTEDIIITGKGSPFVADGTFGEQGPETLVLTSNESRSIIIEKNSSWDLSSFSGKNRIIEIAGNARLICKSGAKIIGKGGVLRFKDSARWIVGSSR